MARQLNSTVPICRQQELPDCDLSISTLQSWAAALDVPISELLVEPENGLSPPLDYRKQMIRLVKATLRLQEIDSPSNAIHHCGLVCQQILSTLYTMMPELKDVNPYPKVGVRLTLEDYGRTAEQPTPTPAGVSMPVSLYDSVKE